MRSEAAPSSPAPLMDRAAERIDGSGGAANEVRLQLSRADISASFAKGDSPSARDNGPARLAPRRP
jgi:hypothetical protein